jgi:hypothetical protein
VKMKPGVNAADKIDGAVQRSFTVAECAWQKLAPSQSVQHLVAGRPFTYAPFISILSSKATDQTNHGSQNFRRIVQNVITRPCTALGAQDTFAASNRVAAESDPGFPPTRRLLEARQRHLPRVQGQGSASHANSLRPARRPTRDGWWRCGRAPGPMSAQGVRGQKKTPPRREAEEAEMEELVRG